MNSTTDQPWQSTQNPLSLTDIKVFFNQFNSDSIQHIENFYHTNTIFVDPIHRIEGISALKTYFLSLCSNEMTCRFEFISEDLVQEPASTSLHSAFLRWHMHYSHPKLAGGKPCLLEGVSYLIFNSKIIYQQDYYDLGAMVYQHLPLMGWAVKKINHRLAGKKL